MRLGIPTVYGGEDVKSAYTGPVLLMAANRQSDKDREKILESLALDQKTERLTNHIDAHIHDIKAVLEELRDRPPC